MIKFKQGYVSSVKTGEGKDIIVKAKAPNGLKDGLIGGGIVLVGITYLTVAAFKNGSKAFEKAEFKTFEDLGIVETVTDPFE